MHVKQRPVPHMAHPTPHPEEGNTFACTVNWKQHAIYMDPIICHTHFPAGMAFESQLRKWPDVLSILCGQLGMSLLRAFIFHSKPLHITCMDTRCITQSSSSHMQVTVDFRMVVQMANGKWQMLVCAVGITIICKHWQPIEL